MNELLKKIVAPQLTFEGVEDGDKFLKNFCDLYRIELFKDGLDLILTKMKEKQLCFEVKIIKGWDTNVGCFLTEQGSYYDDVAGKFIRSHLPKIILRNLSYNLMAHEMAHALEFESEINFGDGFRKAIGFDMKDRSPQSLPLKGEIKRLMVDALKSYKPSQFLSELFARYFELLSVSRNVVARGDFTTAEVMDFFANTTKFVAEIFNPRIKDKIDPHIASITNAIVQQVKLAPPEQKFQENIESQQRKTAGSWTKGVRSNAMWSGGQQFQNLEDLKNKK